MYKRIHGNFLDLLFRRQLDRAPANSHASRVQATPPPCPLCSQKVQNCLPNAYYTWRGSFYGMGISQKMQYLSIFPSLLIAIEVRKSTVFNLCTLGIFHAPAFAADFPPAAPEFYQRTHRVRLKNLGTTDKKSSRKIKYKKIPRVHYAFFISSSFFLT